MKLTELTSQKIKLSHEEKEKLSDLMVQAVIEYADSTDDVSFSSMHISRDGSSVVGLVHIETENRGRTYHGKYAVQLDVREWIKSDGRLDMSLDVDDLNVLHQVPDVHQMIPIFAG